MPTPTPSPPVIDAELAETNGFMRLMQGYLGLGLLIGIAGLGVVMVRAVRERRRQIGMLRAMGFPAAVVRRAFLLEASFVAVQGIVIGIVLGLVTAWQVMTNSDAFGSQGLDLRGAVAARGRDPGRAAHRVAVRHRPSGGAGRPDPPGGRAQDRRLGELPSGR